MFHRSCLLNWLKRDANCPMCRVRLPDRIPRPPSFQEQRLADRLRKQQELWEKGPNSVDCPRTIHNLAMTGLLIPRT